MSIHDLARGTEGGRFVRLQGNLPSRDQDTLVLYQPGEPPTLSHGRRADPATILPDPASKHLPRHAAIGLIEPEDHDRWTLWTFAPPTQLPCTIPLPVRMPDAIRQALGLAIGDDLLQRLTLDFAQDRVGVVAIQHLDTGQGTGGRPLAMYDRKNRKWLLVRPHLDGANSWLEITDDPIPKHVFTRGHHLGAKALLMATDGASWRIDPAGTVEEASLLPLQPQSKGQLAGWARYVALDAETRQRQSAARQKHPLSFDRCEQDGASARWTARVHRSSLSKDAVQTWFPDADQQGREHRIDAAVTLDASSSHKLTLESYLAESAEVLRLRLKVSKDHPVLPPQGNLLAADDKGAAIKSEREREALDRLFSGASAHPRLAALLDEPQLAEEAETRRLATPLTQLNEDQRAAVSKILGCRDLVAILGPPGTGKTSVIAEALRQIALQGSEEHAAPRVLVTSVQNEAVHNVAARVAKQAGLVVHHIMANRTDDEAIQERLDALEQQRQGVVHRLEQALTDSTVAQRRDQAREALTRVDSLRRRARAHPHDVLAEALALPDLPTSVQIELERIAVEYSKPPPTKASAPPEPPPCPDLPADPSQLSDWWAQAAPAIPLTDRAAVQVRVDAVLRAADRAASRPAAATRLDTAMRRLRDALPPPRPPTPPAEDAPGPPPASDLDAQLDTLLAELCRRAREHVAVIEDEPDAIAQRFLHAINEDRRNWSVIVERHGNTVASTTSMSGRREARPEPYDWVIVDEAGRATPPELMVPLVQGRRVVLIGDHLQLPPTVEDALIERVANEGEFSTHDFEETLFQRIFEQLPPGSRQQLSTQYRMHGEIGTVIDQLFYRRHGLQLHSHFSGPKAVERQPLWGQFDDRPLVFVEVPHQGRPCTEENPAEVHALMTILAGYVNAGLDGSEAGQRIGVLVPYRLQRKRIVTALQESRHTHLRRAAFVGTIDAMQGREFPVVLFCTTRTDKQPGFMAATNRINVALSRAQRQLVVIGDRRTLTSPLVQTRAPHLYALVTEHLTQSGHGYRPEGTPCT